MKWKREDAIESTDIKNEIATEERLRLAGDWQFEMKSKLKQKFHNLLRFQLL